MEEIKLKISDSQKHLQNIEQTSGRFDKSKKEKIAGAAKEFESLMTAMMLKAMNQANGGMFGEEGFGGDMFDTIFEQEVASYMARTRSLGIAEAIYKKVTGEEMTPELKYKAGSKSKIEMKSFEPEEGLPGIQPSADSLKRINRFDGIIEEAAANFGISKNIIKSIIMTESAGNHKAVSSAKAKGLMQLMDGTASDMGVKNSFDPKQNIFGGTKYFAQMLRQYNGDLKLALAAYNAGPQNVEKFNGIPPFRETQNYVTKVLGYLKHFEEKQS